MKTIMIAKKNKEIFEKILGRLKYTEKGKGVLTFRISNKRFVDLFEEIRLSGEYPWGLMRVFLSKKELAEIKRKVKQAA